MLYSDWIIFLQLAPIWRHAITCVVVIWMPAVLLLLPWLISKRLKGYFVRVHIYSSVLAELPRYIMQPEQGEVPSCPVVAFIDSDILYLQLFRGFLKTRRTPLRSILMKLIFRGHYRCAIVNQK